jgi:hypothetical protein
LTAWIAGTCGCRVTDAAGRHPDRGGQRSQARPRPAPPRSRSQPCSALQSRRVTSALVPWP